MSLTLCLGVRLRFTHRGGSMRHLQQQRIRALRCNYPYNNQGFQITDRPPNCGLTLFGNMVIWDLGPELPYMFYLFFSAQSFSPHHQRSSDRQHICCQQTCSVALRHCMRSDPLQFLLLILSKTYSALHPIVLSSLTRSQLAR
jgi:hypothetical protein